MNSPAMAGIRATMAARKAFARENDGRVFQAKDRTKPLTGFIIVSVDPTSKKWRATWFDERGPGGHSEAKDYLEAVMLAVAYGADLTTAEFAR